MRGRLQIEDRKSQIPNPRHAFARWRNKIRNSATRKGGKLDDTRPPELRRNGNCGFLSAPFPTESCHPRSPYPGGHRFAPYAWIPFSWHHGPGARRAQRTLLFPGTGILSRYYGVSAAVSCGHGRLQVTGESELRCRSRYCPSSTHRNSDRVVPSGDRYCLRLTSPSHPLRLSLVSLQLGGLPVLALNAIDAVPPPQPAPRKMVAATDGTRIKLGHEPRPIRVSSVFHPWLTLTAARTEASPSQSLAPSPSPCFC